MKSLTETTEIVGLLAILCGAVGGIFQLEKTTRTADVKSFANVYLVLMFFGEALFAVQGFLKGSLTIMAAKSVGTLYFLYMLSFLIFPRKKEEYQGV